MERVGEKAWVELWGKLSEAGWEVVKHGEQKRSHYLLPRGQPYEQEYRNGSYIRHLKGKDGSLRGVYRTRGEVWKHAAGLGIIKKTARKAKNSASRQARPKYKDSAVSPPVSPSLDPSISGPKLMTGKPAQEAPPQPECPVCLTAFTTMPPAKSVLQLVCGHHVCSGCIDEDSGVCPFPDCGQRFVSTRRAQKLTADFVVSSSLSLSPSKPTPQREQADPRQWHGVNIKWQGTKFIATVTKLNRGKFLVHYPGDSKEDEILSREAFQLRAPDWTR